MTLNTIIENIRQSLEQLTWLEKSYGRAFNHAETRDKKVIKLPKCFDGFDYVNVLPNDKLKAQSFIACKGPEKTDEFNRDSNNIKSRDLSLIVWVNLKKIDGTRREIFTHELKQDVEAILATFPEVEKVNQIFDEKVEDIFQGYNIVDIDTQYLMYPYQGFRIDFSVKWFENNCQ